MFEVQDVAKKKKREREKRENSGNFVLFHPVRDPRIL
jgi:hypothetical protein